MHVALVEEHQRVLRQVVDQRRRRLARRRARQVARVVLDALAVADLLQHLEVEARALLEALRLDQLAWPSTNSSSRSRSSSLIVSIARSTRLARRHVVAATGRP